MLNTVLATFSEGAPPIPASSYESIATATGTGSSGTITFSSIPSTYKHLQIRGNVISTGANTLAIRVNGDTGANYAYHILLGNGYAASAEGAASTATALIGFNSAGLSTVYPNPFITDVIDYASTTKYKTIRNFAGKNINNADGNEIDLSSVLWMNTAAITSISIIATSWNFTTSSTISLYGIKG